MSLIHHVTGRDRPCRRVEMPQKGGPSTAEQDFFRSISDIAKSVAAQGVEGFRQVTGDRVDSVCAGMMCDTL